jgi:GNAT superfamily N-acetyltransferase
VTAEGGLATWYVRSEAEGRVSVCAHRGAGFASGETVDPGAAAALDAELVYEAVVGPDGALHVRVPALAGAAPVWFALHVGESDAADLVALVAPGPPSGTVVDADALDRLGVTREDHAAVLRWKRDSGIIDRIYVQPAHRRRGIGSLLVHVADAVHQVRGWPGAIGADGRRTELGERFADRFEHPERVAERTTRVPSFDLTIGLRRIARELAAGRLTLPQPDAAAVGDADDGATWYVRGRTDAVSGRVEVRAFRGPGHRDGAVVDRAEARTDRAAPLWSVALDDESRPVVTLDALDGTPGVWFCALADRPDLPDAVDLVAFATDHVPSGTIIAGPEFAALDVASSEQVGAVRWHRSTGIVELVYVQPEQRRQRLATALVHAASAYHHCHRWPGVLRSDGRRTDLGQRFVVALGQPVRTGAWRERVAPGDPVPAGAGAGAGVGPGASAVAPDLGPGASAPGGAVGATRTGDAPTWYVRERREPSGRWAVDAHRGDAHPDAAVLDARDARLAGTMPVWSVADDDEGRARIRFPGMPTAPPVVLVVLRDRSALPDLVDLVALPVTGNDGPPPGTVLDVAGLVDSGRRLEEQVGAVRWRRSDGRIERLALASAAAGPGQLMMLLAQAASAYHQANGWSGALHADGRRGLRPEAPFVLDPTGHEPDVTAADTSADGSRRGPWPWRRRASV